MRCIFCKTNSENTKGVEHIIPESLGNTEHKLPKGTVCDKCNNYFAIKIEKTLLGNRYFKNLRFRNKIHSKKNRIPPEKGLLIHPNGGWIDLYTSVSENDLILDINNSEQIELITSGKINSVAFEVVKLPENTDLIMSRFLAKTAIEAFTYKLLHEEGWLDEIVDNESLNAIRSFARYGYGEFWKYTQRRVYNEEARFVNPITHPESYEILHEFDFLCIKEGIIYFILVIMGIEYAINLAESETDLYNEWLVKNNHVCPIRRGAEYMITTE